MGWGVREVMFLSMVRFLIKKMDDGFMDMLGRLLGIEKKALNLSTITQVSWYIRYPRKELK